MSTWTLRKVDPLDREWMDFLSSTPHLVFHGPEWAKVADEGLDAEPVALLLDERGEAAGGMCGCSIRALGIRTLYLGLPYGGVLARAPHGPELADLLTEFALSQGITRVVMTPFPGLGSDAYEGFSATALNTFVLQLQGRQSADIRAGYKSQVRRNLRRAERGGVEVEMGHTPADLDTFYTLYLSAMRRNRAIPKYGKPFVQAVGRHLLEQDRGALLLASISGKPTAGILIVDSSRGSHYLMGGSESDSLSHRPNEPLFDFAIHRAVARGFSFFDFLPSGKDHESLERFKQKWGCDPMPANSYELVTRPLSHRLWNGARSLAETALVREVLYKMRG